MKTVKIHLPKAYKQEEKEQFVAVNGVGYRIRKGVDVEVPEAVAEVLRNADQAKLQCQSFLDTYNSPEQ